MALVGNPRGQGCEVLHGQGSPLQRVEVEITAQKTGIWNALDLLARVVSRFKHLFRDVTAIYLIFSAAHAKLLKSPFLCAVQLSLGRSFLLTAQWRALSTAFPAIGAVISVSGRWSVHKRVALTFSVVAVPKR
jgi:hypothetical protein